MKIINRSFIPDDTLHQMINSAIDAYHDVFSWPTCSVEIIVCKDLEDLKYLAEEHTGERDEFREYDGNFLCPQNKTDPFRILLCVKEEALLGADRYFQEKEKGSLRDADLPQAERERRGIDLANFGHFVEMLQHEYSHLCSFEKMMDGTNWEDPHIGAHNMDYHLYDESTPGQATANEIFSHKKPRHPELPIPDAGVFDLLQLTALRHL